MRRLIIAANWKMNKGVEETMSFIEEFAPLVRDCKNEIIIAPPFTSLSAAKESIKGTKIMLAAQNMHEKEKGAYTGEISPLMIKELCQYVILGHSERRQYFNETDKSINKKIISALKNKLKIILCIGETLEERENNKTKEVIKSQLKNCLDGISEIKNIVIAYEPVWAIGTGKTATPEQAEEVHKFIRKLLKEAYNESISNETRVLYGGSVNKDNIKELVKMDNIDGALVGGASLEPKSFSEICNS